MDYIYIDANTTTKAQLELFGTQEAEESANLNNVIEHLLEGYNMLVGTNRSEFADETLMMVYNAKIIEELTSRNRDLEAALNAIIREKLGMGEEE